MSRGYTDRVSATISIKEDIMKAVQLPKNLPDIYNMLVNDRELVFLRWNDNSPHPHAPIDSMHLQFMTHNDIVECIKNPNVGLFEVFPNVIPSFLMETEK